MEEIVLLIDATAQGGMRKKSVVRWELVTGALTPAPWLRPGLRLTPSSRYNSGVRLRIREFEKPDLDALWRIDQACFDAQLAYSRTELALYMRRPGSFTLVAEDEGGEVAGDGKGPATIVGFIVAEIRRKSGHIITIDVVAEARRAGVGSALLGRRKKSCCGREQSQWRWRLR